MDATTRPVVRKITSLQPGELLEDAVFLVKQKDLRTTNNGSLYIHLVLTDATGELLCRMWNASQVVFESIPEGGPVAVRGRVETYKGHLQFILTGVRALEPDAVDLADFLPATKYDVEKMWERLKEILRTVKNPDLLVLLSKFIHDPAFSAAFRKAPAARTNHHAFLGGLLEHTLNLLELAVLVLPRYPLVNADLVLAGLFLHDAGKTSELEPAAGFGYTDDGQLIGHIVRASIWIDEKARQISVETGRPFPPELLASLTHIIVAHHGRYEFGSPKLPATAEAFVVHYLDNLDAKLNMVFNAIASDPDPAGNWTTWVQALETRVYKGPPS